MSVSIMFFTLIVTIIGLAKIKLNRQVVRE